jgi:hypothetical protein
MVAKQTGADVTNQKACAWSAVAALPGCGPAKLSCEVPVKGSVKYKTRDGTETVVQFDHAVTIQRALANR